MTAGADYWDAQAAAFDEAPDHGLRDEGVHRAWMELLAPLAPGANCRVADLGCGTGSLTLLLTSLGHRVSGLDISSAMLARAEAKAAAANLAADFRIGDAAQPPWQDASFDLVLCRHVLWTIADRASALQEWFRILRPGGRLVLIEGLWWTGAGLPAATVVGLLNDAGRPASVMPLHDAALWGQEIADERYLVLSQRAGSARSD